MDQRSPHLDAIRLLFIFRAGSESLSQSDVGAEAIFRGEAKLHAMDFWMRYPDYLADELLDLYEQTNDSTILDEVTRIFQHEEPSIRNLPMIRFRFGAYEQIDDALSILKSRDLIKISGRKSGDKVLETDFYIMPSAFQLLEDVVIDYPALSWYARRSQLVALLAEGKGGAALKSQQYKKIEYAETNLGGTIPSVSERVKERLSVFI